MNREDLQSVIGKIVQNPEFAALVKELQGEENASEETLAKEMNDRIPEAAAMLNSLFGDGDSGERMMQEPKSAPEKERPSEKRFDQARAEKLMTALKPYLKPERCDIIDKCLSVLQLTDMIGMMRELDGGNRTGTERR